MKVKCIKEFNDLVSGTLRKVGEIFEVDEMRGLSLATKDNKAKTILVEITDEEPSDEEPADEEPKKKRASKKEKDE